MRLIIRTALVSSALVLGIIPTVAHSEAGWDGGFVIKADEDGPFKLKVGGRLQTRLTLEAPDGGDTEVFFAVQRARVSLEGYAFSKSLTYKFQADFAASPGIFGDGAPGSARLTLLRDYYLNYAFVEGVELRAGQMKKPFSRQQITSSGKLTLVDRTRLEGGFNAGRDTGLMLHSGYEEQAGGFEWALGVFNGAGENVVPDTWDPQIVLRAGFNGGGLNGKSAYSEGDLECDREKEGSCGARFGVAASAIIDADSDSDLDKGQIEAELDVILKVAGFAITGAFFVDFNLGEEEEGGGMEKMGLYAEASYFIAGPKLLPAVRFVSLMPDDPGADHINEISVGIGFFPAKHNLKWQTDATVIMNDNGDATDDDNTTDFLVRTQLQLAF